MGAGDDGDMPARIEAQAHSFIEYPCILYVITHGAPPQLAALLRFGQTALEILPVGQRDARIQQSLEIAGIVDGAGGRRIGQCGRTNEIAASDFDGRNSYFSSGSIQQTLD